MKYLAKTLLIISLVIYSCSEKKGTRNISGETTKESSAKAVESSAVESSGSISYVNPNISEQGSQSCRDALHYGTMDEFKFISKAEYMKALRDAIAIDYSKHTESESSNSSSIGAALTSYFSFNSENEESRNELNDISTRYRNNSTLDITENDQITIETKIASPVVFGAWSRCMEDYYKSKRGMSIEFSGDTETDFIATINWEPKSDFEPRAVKIEGVSFTSNLAKTGKDNLRKGAKLKRFTGVSQNFTRINKGRASITINIDKFPPLIYEIEGYIPPPLKKPKAVFEPQWMNDDGAGHQYYESFSVDLRECHDCSSPNRFIDNETKFDLSDKSGRIYRVERTCTGGCGWSYNPDGGYEINYSILSPITMVARRRIKGPATTEVYTVYYQKVRNVCVKNCE